MGMRNHIARGRDGRRARIAEMIVEGSQKLEPSWQEREKKKKVVCMST
jgi:hypothetical protein